MRAFRVAYDGMEFRGFQRQPHGDTVEDVIFRALSELGVPFEDGAPVGYAAAGRTDAGVSARAQTVAFAAPEWLTPRAFNGELPTSIRAWASADVAEDFHATYDAVERTYRYFLYGPDIDDERAETAVSRLSGTGDFHNFTPDDEGTERKLSMTVRRDGAFLVVDCSAGGFARQMVRRLVSALESVAAGTREMRFLDRALAETPLEGHEGISAVEPEPLVLLDVEYPDVVFEVDEVGTESTQAVFAERRRRRLAAARVAGSLELDPVDR